MLPSLETISFSLQRGVSLVNTGSDCLSQICKCNLNARNTFWFLGRE
jgi:hypothetical protein